MRAQLLRWPPAGYPPTDSWGRKEESLLGLRVKLGGVGLLGEVMYHSISSGPEKAGFPSWGLGGIPSRVQWEPRGAFGVMLSV